MTNDQVEKFLDSNNKDAQAMQISFKARKSINGIFIKGIDFEELKLKNFWRIVTEQNVALFNKSNDMDFARIYNGSEFTKIAVTK